jgi:hypothetical protein
MLIDDATRALVNTGKIVQDFAHRVDVRYTRLRHCSRLASSQRRQKIQSPRGDGGKVIISRLHFLKSPMAAAAGQVDTRYDNLFVKRLAAANDDHEKAFLHGLKQAFCALDRFKDVYMRSATKTAHKVITLVAPVQSMLLALSDYAHARSNPQGIAWNTFVGHHLLARSRAPSPADKLDNETITALHAFILKVHKVGPKVFQSLADAQAQADDLLSGWKAMLAAIGAANGN